MWAENKLLIVASFLFSLTSQTTRAEPSIQGWGQVNMQGAIIDTACAIAVESRDQTIDMGVVPLSDIRRDGYGKSRPVAIHLVNCVIDRTDAKLPDWKQFQVTFDGDAEGELFGVQGEASGVALKISDKAGNIATPGNPLPLRDLISTSMQLNYTLKLVSNSHTLKSGDYFSSIRFKLDYF